MKKRFFAGMLAITMLAGCGAKRTPPTDTEPASDGPVIAYVPLDDRPDNEERVVYLAESLGYTVALPRRDWYRTKLDGQPLNENGTQYGDRGALFAWVLEQEAGGCDRYILSLDQLLSGGLVNSRHALKSADVVQGPDGEMTVEALLTTLLETLSADGDNRVWLLDSVMRLAPTVGYAGLGLNAYNVLRSYGMEPRPALTGEALSVEAITADYCLSPQGTLIETFSEEPLPDSAVKHYLAARERKLTLSHLAQTLLAGGLSPASEAGCADIHLLIGVDDSSVEDSIQKNEIALLRQGLRSASDGRPIDWLLSGVDDLAFKAVTKLYLEEGGRWTSGGYGAAVRYYGGTEAQPACAYDYQPLEDIVAEHLAFFDLNAPQPDSRETRRVEILVLTQPADTEEKGAYCDALLADLQACQAQNLPVILIDAGNGAYGTAFHDALTEKAELGALMSYAGFLDMAIVTGTAMSHGIARYARLCAGDVTEAENRAFARTLADSILKDFCYKNVVRNDILSFVRNELSGSADNFWNPAIDLSQAQLRLEAGMAAVTPAVVRNLERSNLTVSLDQSAPQNGLVGWGGVALENYRFPWDRAFEIGMDIRLGAFTPPHRHALGIYYR